MKALSGFYYVEHNGTIITCKGRGVFRNRKITPLVGDFVEFDHTENEEGYITAIKPRKNELVRPPIANITQGIIVSSIVTPNFSPLLLDRFIVLLETKSIKPMILITKADIADSHSLDEVMMYKDYYQSIGYHVSVSNNTKQAVMDVRDYLKEEVTVLVGQSGAGKSTFLNNLDPELELETKEISTSLGRGKHTTRHVELLQVNQGLIADTPGFSSLEFPDMAAGNMADAFIDFHAYQASCKFRGCLHHKEPGCAVKEAVEDKDLPEFRYEHYLLFLQELLSRKPRY